MSRLFVKASAGRQRFNVLGALNAITHELILVTNDTYIAADSVCALLRKIAALPMRIGSGKIRRIGHDRIKTARTARRQPIALHEHHIGATQPARIVPRHRERRGAAIQRHDAPLRPCLSQREGKRAAAGAEIGAAQRPRRRPCGQRPLDQ